jgi:hypothetical protein
MDIESTNVPLVGLSLLLGICIMVYGYMHNSTIRMLIIGMIFRQLYRTSLTVHWTHHMMSLSVTTVNNDLFPIQTYLAICIAGIMMQSSMVMIYYAMFMLFEIAVIISPKDNILCLSISS